MYEENRTLAVIQALQRSTELLDEALYEHIYDERNDGPVLEDSSFALQIAENKRLLGAAS